jgi:hypothetical protein
MVAIRLFHSSKPIVDGFAIGHRHHRIGRSQTVKSPGSAEAPLMVSPTEWVVSLAELAFERIKNKNDGQSEPQMRAGPEEHRLFNSSGVVRDK